MSVAVCRGPTMPAFEAPCWLKKPAEQPYKPAEAVVAAQHPPARVDIWNAIQAADVDAKKQQASSSQPKPYVHPLVRRSSSLMSQKSLEVCTESLGNETGSGDFTSSLDMAGLFDSPLPAAEAESSFWGEHGAARDREAEAEEEEDEDACDRKTTGLAAVNYHCSAAGTRSPRRAFPPPLPSMSRRDGPCLQMRPRREDGRLVVEAVAVRPRGYLHARRQNGRLCLSFVECSAREQSPRTESSNVTIAAAAEAPFFPAVEPKNEQEEEVEMEDEEEEMEEEEEEVEVVDRGTVVEVKVSTQPQTPAAGKVHRSRLVINKFVGSTPLSADQQTPRCHAADTAHSEASSDEEVEAQSPKPTTLRRVPSSTTTLAAAVAVASTGTDDDRRRRVRRDARVRLGRRRTEAAAAVHVSARGQAGPAPERAPVPAAAQKPLFILEPYCIATS
ncbi:hypothetical protein EJB05_04955, partial [Eragrostis curvula]